MELQRKSNGINVNCVRVIQHGLIGEMAYFNAVSIYDSNMLEFIEDVISNINKEKPVNVIFEYFGGVRYGPTDFD